MAQPAANATTRFSNRVEDYIKYRPHYPTEATDWIITNAHISHSSTIADVGSGTGILSKPLLEKGFAVIGIEPNKDMREAGERYLSQFTTFTSIDGTAEATSLPNNSIDLITAGQAFHWFDKTRCRIEFERVLRPHGQIALVWNERKTNGSPFLRDYEALLKNYSIDYEQIDHRNVTDDVIQAFFFGGKLQKAIFPNVQVFDLTGLRGRLESSSYVPKPDHPNYPQMIDRLEKIFAEHERNGTIDLEYDCNVYLGQFAD